MKEKSILDEYKKYIDSISQEQLTEELLETGLENYLVDDDSSYQESMNQQNMNFMYQKRKELV